jgi:UDP-N-acetylmuramoylalanine--D-glutamate ligase
MSTNIKNSEVSEKSLTDKLVESRKLNVDEFGGIEHRLELISNVNGVDYVNDSKATDVNSTWYSLECMDKPVVWILGLSDMKTDYSIFNDLAQKNVKAIVYLGKNIDGTLNSLIERVDCFSEASSVSEAVQIAKSLAANGDVVLFSPACSSFHLYQNYRDRGEQFRKSVSEL